MKRFGRHLSTLVAAVSLLLAVATTFLWSRSYRAFDQSYGVAWGYNFDVEAHNGQCEVRLVKLYQTRAGVGAAVRVDRVARPFDVLEEYQRRTPIPNFVTRQRWPLQQTRAWRADPPLFPAPAFTQGVAWARDGPGRYNWTARCRIPYWLACVVFASVPMLVVAKRVRRARAVRAGRRVLCGDDMEESSDRRPRTE